MTAVAAALGLLAAPAAARWTTISASPSQVLPAFVCARREGRPGCDLVQDPTLGSRAPGPVAAGAITRGPEQQVSPSLNGSGEEGGYSPEDLRSAYDLPDGGGAGQTVAIVDAYDDPDAEADLSVYRSRYSLGACTAADGCLRRVNQLGGSTYPGANPKWAKEISLDLDMVSAICPECHILLVEASSESASNLAAAEDEAVALGATEISDSFSEPGQSLPTAALRAAYDHPGIPITASAGDSGYGVETPAASANVIAVGGTTLEKPASPRGRWVERAWLDSGSGCSDEPKPPWQTDTGCAGRTLNDAAAVADPNTPVSVYDSYGTGSQPWLLEGGTSVGAPLIAAELALSDAYTRSFSGAQALYVAHANNSGAFEDITEGANGNCGKTYLCEAGPGYDGPTGLGSLHGVLEVPPPEAQTGQASQVSQTGATLQGEVNPHGVTPEACSFEYGPGYGYTASAPCSHSPGSGTSAVAVSAAIVGLAPGSAYHYRLALRYPGGTSQGAQVAFATLPAAASGEPGPPALHAPVAVTAPPSDVTAGSAQLNGTVEAGGEPLSSCGFEFNGPGDYVPCSSLPSAGAGAAAVSADVAGLAPLASLEYRLVATDAAGTGSGAIQTFMTLAAEPFLSSVHATGAVLLSTRLHAGPRGAALVRVLCPRGAPPCTGQLTLQTLRPKHGGRAAWRPVELAYGSFSIAPGHAAMARIQLTPSGRRLLASARRLLVAALVLTRGASAAQITRVSVVALQANR